MSSKEDMAERRSESGLMLTIRSEPLPSDCGDESLVVAADITYPVFTAELQQTHTVWYREKHTQVVQTENYQCNRSKHIIAHYTKISADAKTAVAWHATVHYCRQSANSIFFHTPLVFLSRIWDHRILRSKSASACKHMLSSADSTFCCTT